MSNPTPRQSRMYSAMRLMLIVLLAGPAAPLVQAQSKQMVFMQIADTQMGMFTRNADSEQEIHNLKLVVDTADRLHPAFLVVCGDLVNSSRNTAEADAFRSSILSLHGIPLHLVTGNHDVGDHPTEQLLRQYRERFGPDYYTFQSGDMTGIVLDSMLMGDNNAPDEDARQYKWLQDTLSHLSSGELAVFQHIPFFVHSENEPDSYWNVPSAARAQYLALLRQSHVEHVFAGYLHRPVRTEAPNVTIIIAGATRKPPGYSSSGLGLVAVPASGTWQDKFFPLDSPPEHLAPPW